MSIEDNRSRMASLEEQIKRARIAGALYHPTNPVDSWYCVPCGVFGRGTAICWACDSAEVQTQWVPRFGGGAQSVNLEPELAV